MPDKRTILNVKLLAAKIRRDVVMMIGGDGQTGHLGGSCSSADIVASLYGYKMKLRPQEPYWEGRDKFIYSKGHAAIAQYAAMAEVGYFPVQELSKVKTLGCRLQGHPDRAKLPGIEAGTGSLGQGLSIANGLALAMKLDRKPNRVYCIMGDGEMDEGQIWEAAMAAAHYRIDNLTAFVDSNGLQATGPVKERMNSAPLAEKWKSFGWNVLETDGNDVEKVIGTLEEAETVLGMPTVIIAHTVKGKGVSFAENAAGFHNGSLTKEQYETALEELSQKILELEATLKSA